MPGQAAFWYSWVGDKASQSHRIDLSAVTVAGGSPLAWAGRWWRERWGRCSL